MIPENIARYRLCLGMAVIPVQLSDRTDDVLLAWVNEAWQRYLQDRTPDNLDIHRQAMRQFADWALPGIRPRNLNREATADAGIPTSGSGRA